MVHGDIRRETQSLKAFANHTMLTPPQCVVHLEVFKISVGRDLQNLTSRLHGWKLNSSSNSWIPNYIFQRSKSNWHLFKILKFSGPSLLCMTLSTLQPYFLSGGLLWQMVIVISSVHVHQTVPNDSKPYQTE